MINISFASRKMEERKGENFKNMNKSSKEEEKSNSKNSHSFILCKEMNDLHKLQNKKKYGPRKMPVVYVVVVRVAFSVQPKVGRIPTDGHKLSHIN